MNIFVWRYRGFDLGRKNVRFLLILYVMLVEIKKFQSEFIKCLCLSWGIKLCVMGNSSDNVPTIVKLRECGPLWDIV